jgi:hypothetical protein
MAIQIASGTIYLNSLDHPKRPRIISPVAVFSVANVCWRILNFLFASGIPLVGRD